MRRLPSFVLLRAFEAAARLGSFARAADELSLTPSAISHQIRELEAYFGRPMFLRRNRRVEVTPEGQRLHASVTRILDALEQACSDVTLAPDEEILAVHCAPSLAVKWLGPRLAGFIADHPAVTIRLSTGAEPVDLVQARDIDVAISYGAARARPGINVTPLGAERIVPLIAPAALAALTAPAERAASTTPDAVLAASILIDSQLSPLSWRDWFRANGLSLPARARPSFDRAALAIAAAVDGMGIALESTRLAERELARGELVELGRDHYQSMARPVHFLCLRASQRHIRKIAAFSEWVLRECGAAPAAAVEALVG